MQRIKNLSELKAHLRRGHRDFAIALVGGAAVSRKYITPLSNGRFDLFNGIDGTVVEEQTGRELLTRTNIGKAMRRGAFFCEECKRDGEEPVAVTT